MDEKTHQGICSECNQEGAVISVRRGRKELSLCPDCLAKIVGRATGYRGGVLRQWKYWRARKKRQRD